jgi:hypothetical protein
LRLLQNPGNDNDWLNLRLVGVKSNRSAVGAEIKVTVTNDGGAPRPICRTVGQSSSFGGNPLEQHIGLGHGARIVSVEVFWPVSGTRQKFAGVAKNEFLEIKEFASSFTRLERKKVVFGPGKTVARAR